jgi:hypothetical protein
MNGFDVRGAHAVILQYFPLRHDSGRVSVSRLTALHVVYTQIIAARFGSAAASRQCRKAEFSVEPDIEAGDPNRTIKRAAGRIFRMMKASGGRAASQPEPVS